MSPAYTSTDDGRRDGWGAHAKGCIDCKIGKEHLLLVKSYTFHIRMIFYLDIPKVIWGTFLNHYEFNIICYNLIFSCYEVSASHRYPPK